MKEVWHKFLRWRGWAACAQGWRAFVHWRGWKAFVQWDGWKRFARWKLWHPHPLVSLVLCVLSAAGLVRVFTMGLEESVPAYFVYALSAYSLTVLAIGIPDLIRWVKGTVLENRLVKPLVEDENKRFLLDLFREEIVNLCYGVYKTVTGVLLGSAWVGTDGIYNLVQGIIQLGQLIQHRRHLPADKQWKSYRVCGWMILAVHLTMTGPIYLMIHRGQAEEYPGFMIFATAAFTFYKLIKAFWDVARERRAESPVDTSVDMLDLTQAMFSLFSLQVSMIHAFDDGSLNVMLMNSLTGGAVCLLVMATGIYMIRRAGRELTKLREEKENGRIL